jgi:ribosome-binding protein aMBF1 (putative translation factor)
MKSHAKSDNVASLGDHAAPMLQLQRMSWTTEMVETVFDNFIRNQDEKEGFKSSSRNRNSNAPTVATNQRPTLVHDVGHRVVCTREHLLLYVSRLAAAISIPIHVQTTVPCENTSNAGKRLSTLTNIEFSPDLSQ